MLSEVKTSSRFMKRKMPVGPKKTVLPKPSPAAKKAPSSCGETSVVMLYALGTQTPDARRGALVQLPLSLVPTQLDPQALRALIAQVLGAVLGAKAGRRIADSIPEEVLRSLGLVPQY